MRVLAVVPGSAEGKIMIFAKRQVAALKGRKHDVAEFYVADRVSPLAVLGEYRRLRQKIEEFKPEIVHAHYGTVTALLVVVASGRVPSVVTFRGSDLNPSEAVSRFRSIVGRFISQISALFATRVVCVSANLAASLWVRSHKVAVIPSGVDLKAFRPMDYQESRLRLGFAPATPLLVFNCGGDQWVKNLALAEKVFAEVRKQMGNVEFEIMRSNWRPEDVPSLFSAADCLLVVSRYEGSPNVVKEAMACNLPIVSVDVGDVRQRLERVENCFVVDAAPEVLADQVVQVLAKRDRSNGRIHCQEFSQTEVLDRLERVYVDSIES